MTNTIFTLKRPCSAQWVSQRPPGHQGCLAKPQAITRTAGLCLACLLGGLCLLSIGGIEIANVPLFIRANIPPPAKISYGFFGIPFLHFYYFPLSRNLNHHILILSLRALGAQAPYGFGKPRLGAIRIPFGLCP